MLEQGVWAEVKVGGEHIRLFSEENALGVQSSVYRSVPSEGRQPRTTFVNVEAIPLGVANAALSVEGN